jgi:hypothetical protein
MTRGGLYNVNPLATGDIFWNASAWITQRLFQKQAGVAPAIEDNHVWIVTTAVTILGFLAYRILIDSWLRSENFLNGAAKVAFDDTLRFTVMFSVVQLLSGGSLSDPEWVKTSGLFVGSLVTYDLLAHNMVAEQTRHLNPNVATAVQDVVKFGVAFTLHNFATKGANAFDKNWAITTAGYLTGVAIYDLFLAQYLVGKGGLYAVPEAAPVQVQVQVPVEVAEVPTEEMA